MKFIDFKKREIIETKDYHTEKIDLKIYVMMDMKLSSFISNLEDSIKMKLQKSNIKNIEKPIYFKVYTDLDKFDLSITRESIAGIIVDFLIKDRNSYKHNEKILAVPESLYTANMVVANVLDLINYNLFNERFRISFYDDNNESITRE